jgi:hypothetical protein
MMKSNDKLTKKQLKLVKELGIELLDKLPQERLEITFNDWLRRMLVSAMTNFEKCKAEAIEERAEALNSAGELAETLAYSPEKEGHMLEFTKAGIITELEAAKDKVRATTVEVLLHNYTIEAINKMIVANEDYTEADAEDVSGVQEIKEQVSSAS